MSHVPHELKRSISVRHLLLPLYPISKNNASLFEIFNRVEAEMKLPFTIQANYAGRYWRGAAPPMFNRPRRHVRRGRSHFCDGKPVDQSKNDFLADLSHSSRAIAPTRRRDQPGRILRMPARRCRRLPIGQTPVRSRNPERVQANLSKGWQGDKPFGFVGPACGPDCRRLKSKI